MAAFFNTVIVLLLLLPSLIIEASSAVDCTRSKECDCTLNFRQYVYSCPPFPNETDIIVTLEPENNPTDLQIDCVHANSSWEKLPQNLQLGDLRTFIIRSCPFPPSNFMEIMNKFGVNETESFIYEFGSASNIRLSKKHFVEMGTLQRLHMENNELEVLEEDVFEEMPNLVEIRLGGNKLHQLPNLTFSFVPDLVMLDLGLNQLESLPLSIFQNLTKLDTLHLQHNNLTTLKAGIFKDLGELTVLNLSYNHLSNSPFDDNLHFELFDGLAKLKILDLSYNELHETNSYFDSLQDLEELYLNNNVITIVDEAFIKLHALKKLVLSNNQLRKITNRAFTRNMLITEISLAHNQLENVETYFGNSLFDFCIRIKQLDLSHNLISRIPPGITTVIRISELQKLDLSYNSITSIAVEQLQMLSIHPVEFNLSNNNISKVDFSFIEALAKQQGQLYPFVSNAHDSVVNLLNNPIDCDCRAFHLSQYFNDMMDPRVRRRIQILPDGLKCASPPEFREVYVEELHPQQLTCQLEQLVENYTDCPSGCSCQFRQWDKSVTISCENGNLTRVPQVLLPSALKYNQTEVHLEGNLLTVGPSSRDIGYENVTRLFLSNNRIKQIDWIPPKTEVLHLHQNNIERLNYPVLDVLNTSGLVNITLHDNPWKCDCFATNLTKFLRLHLKQVNPRQIKCFKEKVKLIDQTEKELLCHSYTVLILMLFICSAILICVGVALFYRYQHIKAWFFAHNLLHWFCTEETGQSARVE